MKFRVRVAVPLLVGVIACGTAKREAGSLVAAVDRFHRAENSAKPARADEVAVVACRDAEVCEAKKLCTDATGQMAAGLRLSSEVQAKMSDLEAGTLDRGEVSALTAKLEDAGRLHREGYHAMLACDGKVTALRLKYGL
jgi:hypothetical protein